MKYVGSLGSNVIITVLYLTIKSTYVIFEKKIVIFMESRESYACRKVCSNSFVILDSEF